MFAFVVKGGAVVLQAEDWTEDVGGEGEGVEDVVGCCYV